MNAPESATAVTTTGRIPLHLIQWVQQNAAAFQPPTGGKVIWRDAKDFIVVLLGQNQRCDWHTNPTEEFYFQLVGDMTLKTRSGREVTDVPIREGELYLLPANVCHSPQRPAHTLGLVLECRRAPGEIDHIEWYCQGCGERLYGESGEINGNLVGFIDAVTERYRGKPAEWRCRQCGMNNPSP